MIVNMIPATSTFVILLSALTELTNAAPLQADDASQCQRSKVLVLGAGMAGVSAGNTLSQKGIQDFKIIEYQGRIGGRTLHTSFGKKADGSSWTVELGTNWITGLHTANGSNPGQGKYNPIWGLAKEANLTTLSDEGPDPIYYNQNGPYNWSNYSAAWRNASNRLSDLAFEYIEDGKHDVSTRAGLELVGWDSTNDMYKQAAEWQAYETDGAAPIDLSSMIFGEIGAAASEGPILGEYSRFVLDQRGYDLVTRQLASHYLSSNDPRLVLNSPVTNITYSNDTVTVRTANNTCYQADYAICTFSLGVLQRAINGKAPVHFSPAFPQWKSESVLANVMGIYTKIFFQFKPEEIFWPKNVTTFYYADPTIKGYWGIWQSLDYPGSPLEGSGIFFSTMTWDQSKRIEQQPDDATMREGLAVLKRMFPNATIPGRPEAFVYARWGETEWAYGSYSNWANGFSLEQHTNFRANLGRLWFAGEATSSEYWGYLHGAYYEGQLAGEEVAGCVKNGTKACGGRKRFELIAGNNEADFNKENGFQDSIGDFSGN